MLDSCIKKANLEGSEHSVKTRGFPDKVNAEVSCTLGGHISHSLQL